MAIDDKCIDCKYGSAFGMSLSEDANAPHGTGLMYVFRDISIGEWENFCHYKNIELRESLPAESMKTMRDNPYECGEEGRYFEPRHKSYKFWKAVKSAY